MPHDPVTPGLSVGRGLTKKDQKASGLLVIVLLPSHVEGASAVCQVVNSTCCFESVIYML